MKYLETYNIFEGRQRGNLYHIFDLNKCIYILDNNKLASYKFGNISTTRNKQMNYYLGSGPASIFKLELDGDKITNNYKVRPFQYQSYEGPERNPVKLTEWEEVIKTREIPNLNKYVKKFIILKDRIEKNLKNTAWFDSDGGHLNSNRMTIPDFLKKYLTRIKELFGDIWVQEGSVIKKDDEWIEKIINYPIKQIHHGYALYWRGYKKHPRDKYGSVDDIQPIDKKNKDIDELVIGYNYKNLYLSKNKDFDLPEPMENYKLYLFDFVYEIEDIIEEGENYIYVSDAKLKNIIYSF
jgi:hypothetical protein